MLFENPLQYSHGIVACPIGRGTQPVLCRDEPGHEIVASVFVREVELVHRLNEVDDAAQLRVPDDVPRRARREPDAAVDAGKVDEALQQVPEPQLRRRHNVKEHVQADEGREEEQGLAVVLGDVGRRGVEQRQRPRLQVRRLLAVLLLRRGVRGEHALVGCGKGQQLIHEKGRRESGRDH